MKKQKLIFFIFSLMVFHANILLSNSFQGERNVTINEEVNEDLYLAGGNILVDAPIRGDLICAGGDVTVQDTVTEDILLAGGTIKLNGYIGDDLRVAGGTVVINNDINGDLVVAAGEVTVNENVTIYGKIKMIGGELLMNGTVIGKADLRGGEIVWDGTAQNDFSAKAGSLILNGTIRGNSQLAAHEIEIGNNAKLYGDVEYWNSEGSMDFGNVLLSGATSTYNADLKVYPSDINWRYMGVGMVTFWIYRLLTAALIIGLLIWMFHRFFSRNGVEANQHYLSHLGYGALYVIGLPILIIVAFMTVIGIPVGFGLVGFYILTIALGHILASLLIAYGVNYYYKKNWNRRTLFLATLCSYLALKLVGAIPFLGFVVSLVVVTMAFGTVLYVWWKSRRTERPALVE